MNSMEGVPHSFFAPIEVRENFAEKEPEHHRGKARMTNADGEPFEFRVEHVGIAPGAAGTEFEESEWGNLDQRIAFYRSQSDTAHPRSTP